MYDVDILLKAILSLHVRNYDNQIDYLCDVMTQYNRFKSEELHRTDNVSNADFNYKIIKNE